MFWRTIGGMFLTLIDAFSILGMPFFIWYFLSEMQDAKGFKAFLWGLVASIFFTLWLFGWILDGYTYDMSMFL